MAALRAARTSMNSSRSSTRPPSRPDPPRLEHPGGATPRDCLLPAVSDRNDPAVRNARSRLPGAPGRTPPAGLRRARRCLGPGWRGPRPGRIELGRRAVGPGWPPAWSRCVWRRGCSAQRGPRPGRDALGRHQLGPCRQQGAPGPGGPPRCWMARDGDTSGRRGQPVFVSLGSALTARRAGATCLSVLNGCRVGVADDRHLLADRSPGWPAALQPAQVRPRARAAQSGHLAAAPGPSRYWTSVGSWSTSASTASVSCRWLA